MPSIHSSLSNPSTSTRLLELLLDCSSYQAKCRLHEIGLSHVAADPPKYEALSHHRGPPTPGRSITVNTRLFEVARNMRSTCNKLVEERDRMTNFYRIFGYEIVGTDLLNYLVRCRLCECSNPRDEIFAALKPRIHRQGSDTTYYKLYNHCQSGLHLCYKSFD